MFEGIDPAAAGDALFPEKERRVFAYASCGRTLWADPLAVGRRLAHALGGDVNAALAQAHDESEDVRFEADERVLRATRFAFEMPYDPATGEGATEEEARAALAAYEAFLQKKSPSGGTPPPSCTPSPEAFASPTPTGPSSDSF